MSSFLSSLKPFMDLYIVYFNYIIAIGITALLKLERQAFGCTCDNTNLYATNKLRFYSILLRRAVSKQSTMHLPNWELTNGGLWAYQIGT
jgi:hypothetical protein